MLVIGTFEHSLELEQVLAILENDGIPRQCFLVIPMDTDPPSALQYLRSPTDRYSRGVEAGMACATAGSVVGTCFGFILAWGPIFCGLAAALACFAVGFCLYRLINKGTRPKPEKLPEVTAIIQSHENQSTLIINTMWQYRALSVGRAPEPSIYIAPQ
ncbi:MAG: hypothetical protein P4N59_11770 [Negativicutes bacterium]|nr:hypothetical protein [Negativicutes bacterium]